MTHVKHLILFLLLVFPNGAARADESATEPANYTRPFEPPTRPALLPLPPGAVEPAGWLRDWCLAARDGFTGHMDEVDDEFKRAWATEHQMTGERLRWYQGAWPYEGGGYWFDGLARLGYALHDDALIAQAKRRLYAVADPMNTDGLLFLWWLDRNKPGDRQAVNAALDGWPLWACGLLTRTACDRSPATCRIRGRPMTRSAGRAIGTLPPRSMRCSNGKTRHSCRVSPATANRPI